MPELFFNCEMLTWTKVNDNVLGIKWFPRWNIRLNFNTFWMNELQNYIINNLNNNLHSASYPWMAGISPNIVVSNQILTNFEFVYSLKLWNYYLCFVLPWQISWSAKLCYQLYIGRSLKVCRNSKLIFFVLSWTYFLLHKEP